jgi:hypothetical protein
MPFFCTQPAIPAAQICLFSLGNSRKIRETAPQVYVVHQIGEAQDIRTALECSSYCNAAITAYRTQLIENMRLGKASPRSQQMKTRRATVQSWEKRRVVIYWLVISGSDGDDLIELIRHLALALARQQISTAYRISHRSRHHALSRVVLNRKAAILRAITEPVHATQIR